MQNPVNGRFWLNLGFRNLSSWTARNLKFCLQHEWCSTTRSSKFQVICSFTSRDIKHRNLHFPEPILRRIYDMPHGHISKLSFRYGVTFFMAFYL